MNKNRHPATPYSALWGLMTPFKTAVILIILLAGLAWLVGAMLENALPRAVTRAAAIVFVAVALAYSALSIYAGRRREKFARQCRAARKAKIAQFEALGFSPTFKSVGSSRYFAVDETMGKWYLIDYFNNPDQVRLHDVSSITGVMEGLNREYVPRGHKVLLFNGKRLGANDNRSYFSQTGVVIKLNEKDCPREFINCFKTENDVGIIMGYLQRLLDKQP